jgi:hypothetical protein
VPEDYIEKYHNTLEGLEITPDPANDDYVYSSQDLIALKGRRYDGKRNAMRKLQREWSYEYRAINEELIRLCLELEDLWCVQRQCESYPGLVEEERAIREIFASYKALGVKGGAILLDGRVAAFSLGEQLNEDTLVVHVEKADLSIRGLYAVINQQFTQSEGSTYEYINREQDLGDKGLKAAKKSYYPTSMVRKFKVGFRTVNKGLGVP